MSTKILSSEIETRASERMTDSTDGGGEMSGVVIVDNKINQMFGPVSDSDRLTGRVSLRQGYLHITTDTDDIYFGANLIIDKPFNDPNLNCLLFDIGYAGAERLQAQNYIESYIVPGARARMHPYGTQLAGQLQVLAYQDATVTELPDIGDIVFLSNESTGEKQACKIQDIDSYEETVLILVGTSYLDWKIKVIILTITQSLVYTFPGEDPNKTRPGDTWIRNSIVSDSVNYYGTTTLKNDALTNDSTITVTTTQAQLLPVTTTETPVLNTPIATASGEINAGSHNVTVYNFAHSSAEKITISNNGLVFVKTLKPIPAPGTYSFSYRSGGKWYTLVDDGEGNITGASINYGIGTINYTTGIEQITLGAQPDIDSSLIRQWGSEVHYRQQLTASIVKPTSFFQLGEPVNPSSLEFNYVKSSTPYMVSANSSGFFSNSDLEGFVVVSTGDVFVKWLNLPDSGSQIQIDYDTATQQSETLTDNAWINWPSFSGNLPSTPTLTNTPIAVNSVYLYYDLKAIYY